MRFFYIQKSKERKISHALKTSKVGEAKETIKNREKGKQSKWN